MNGNGTEGYFAAATLVLFLGLALTRALWMRKEGIKAIHFGSTDKKDFFIPPFVLFYFYTIFAAAFHWPSVSEQVFVRSDALSWIGVLLCFAGLLMVVWSLVSFGRSFRIGIDTDRPGKLITTGAFGVSRNPIYVGFWIGMLGQVVIFPNWILLAYLAAAVWLFHRQVLREEAFLAAHYGSDFADYANRVRRYL